MTRLKRFLRNSAKSGLFRICVTLTLISGCTSSTSPTYRKEEINQAIQDICKKEYDIEVKVRQAGSTLWVYMPLERLLVPLEESEKYTETFQVEENKGGYREGIFNFQYSISQASQEEKFQNVKLDKSVMEKINNVLQVMRRVLFSMDRKERSEPKFICVVCADIKEGILLSNVFYYLDFKKFLYGIISLTEYQHRSIDEFYKSEGIIGDKEGERLKYADFTLEDFLSLQILHRIKLKFQKPEVERNADIDKEVLKIITQVIKIYGVKDFSAVEIDNLLTRNRITLNRQAIWERPSD